MNSAEIIQKELEWLERVIKARLEFPKVNIFDREALDAAINKSNSFILRKEEYDLTLPNLTDYSSNYSQTAKSLDWKERLMLILTLSIQVESGFIDRIIERSQYKEIIEKMPGFEAASGVVGKSSYGYRPTGRLWLFLLAGYDNVKRIGLLNKVLGGEIYLLTSNIVEVTYTEEHEPFLGGILMLNRENLSKLLL